MSLPRCGVRDKVGFGESRAKRYALQGQYIALFMASNTGNVHFLNLVEFILTLLISNTNSSTYS